ncbi:hypothetical protein [Sulfuracidifex tepidarius]|uniref:Archaemetzincin n=1 Tax=Sulfuracidifex tepidarius TaxID=1294262 RepID=A0A510DVX5_9CREN|nr:hypothetical protein [Sulfuracidifex tepidarius]BBG24372.1 hypothetical protein IC006_1684 [Sulfuracidifex tepidarius]BBG27130.1 hypothetical protein IC007_1662 [Sulfuracidifex tepidarius]
MGLGDTLREPYLGISEKGSPEAPTKVLISLLNTVDREKLIRINQFINEEFKLQTFTKLEKEFLPISAFDWKELKYNEELILKRLDDRIASIRDNFLAIIFIGELNLIKPDNSRDYIYIVSTNTPEDNALKEIGRKLGSKLGLSSCDHECLMNPTSSSLTLCNSCKSKLKKG